MSKNKCQSWIFNAWKDALLDRIPVAWSNRAGDSIINSSKFDRYRFSLKEANNASSIKSLVAELEAAGIWDTLWKKIKRSVGMGKPITKEVRDWLYRQAQSLANMFEDAVVGAMGDNFKPITGFARKKINTIDDLERLHTLLTDPDSLGTPLMALDFWSPQSSKELRNNAGYLKTAFDVPGELTKKRRNEAHAILDAYQLKTPADIAAAWAWSFWSLVKKSAGWYIYAGSQVIWILSWHSAAYVGSLTISQIFGMASEFRKGNWKFRNEDLTNFRKEFWIQYIEWEVPAPSGNFRKAYWWVINLIKETTPHYYNIMEVSFKWRRINSTFDWVLKNRYPEFSTIEDLTHHVRTLNKEDRLDFLTRLNWHVADRYLDTSAQSIKWADGAVVFNKNSFLPIPIQAGRHFMRSFLWMYGAGHLRNWYRIIKDFWSVKKFEKNFEKHYLELLTQPGGFEKARDFAYWIYRKNAAFIDLMSKIGFSIHLWTYIDRWYNEDKEKDLWAILQNTINFAYPLQFLTTTQIGREAMNFFTQVGADIDNDGKTTWRDLESASYSTLNKFLNNIGRRFIVGKWIASWLWRAWVTDWNAVEKWIAWFEKWWDTMMSWAQWYAYFFEEEMTKSEYELYVPRWNFDVLSKILWYENWFIKEFRDLSSEKQLFFLTEKDENKMKRFTTWLSYRIPFVAQFKFWTFDELDYTKELYEKLDKDEKYKAFEKWDIPFEWDIDFGEFAYNKLTEFAKYDTSSGDQDRFEDMRANYNFGKNAPMEYKQWKEDVFVSQMLNILEDWDKEKFMQQFKSSIKTGWKVNAQMLWFLESKWPGSAREYVAAIVNEEFTQAMKDHNAWKNPKAMKQIKAYLWEKYWATLRYTDKLTYGELWLFYIRKEYPEYEDKIASPYNDKGSPSKTMKFIFGEDNWKDNGVTSMYLMDTVARINIANWDADAYKLTNVFSTLFMSKKIDREAPGYHDWLFGNLNNVIDIVDNSDLSFHEQSTIKQSLFIALWPEILKIEKDSVMREEESYKLAIENLFWSIQDSDHLEWLIDEKKADEEVWLEIGKSWSSKYYTSSGAYDSNFTTNRKKYSRMHSDIYKAFNEMKYKFNFSNYQRYGKTKRPTSYYSKWDWDFLQSYAKNQSSFFKWITTSTGPRKSAWKPKRSEWRLAKQFAWFAQPGGIERTYDILKPTERDANTFKRTIRRATVKYDSFKTRWAVTKWWISSLFSKKGLWGSNSSGS